VRFPLARSASPTGSCLALHIPEDTLPTGHAGMAERLRLGPRLHPSAFVVPNATVVGDVTLHEEASVWYGAVLRGDINRIIIGARSNIQDRAVVHLSDDYPAIVGERVTVGHGAIIHACTVDDEVLIGMGAIILDGAEIGARSIIGAHTLVTVGTKISPGSLVLGSPGKVVRQLSLDEQATIKTWALKYVANAKYFRKYYAAV
jgi:gamma-carbonic anhydrase